MRSATLKSFAARFADHGFRSTSFLACYGLAEATLLVSSSTHSCGVKVRSAASQLLDTPRSSRRSRREAVDLVSSGKPFGDTEICIVDPATGKLCASGTIGEIWVRGESVSPGYWGDVPRTPEDYLHTGDLGFIADGELFVSGRLKDMFVIRGINLFPEDIEETIRRSHPLLAQEAGAAFAIEDAEQEKLVVVQEVDPYEWATSDHLELRSEALASISNEYGVSLHDLLFVMRSTLPRTTSGKVSRHACRLAHLQGELRDLSPQPSIARRLEARADPQPL